MNYAWNWKILLEDPYAGWLVSGLELTFLMSLAAWLTALLFGTALGVIGSLPGRSRWLLTAYVAVFRNVPLILQLFLWFFVLPELLPSAAGHWLKRDLPFPELWTAILGLALFTSARIAVQVRAGIRAVGAGQLNAAFACGMTLVQAYRHILLPQALRLIMPPLTSEFLTVFKNSALALTIGVFELTAQSRQIESYTFSGFEAFTEATAAYVLIALAVTVSMQAVEHRLKVPGTGNTAA